MENTKKQIKKQKLKPNSIFIKNSSNFLMLENDQHLHAQSSVIFDLNLELKILIKLRKKYLNKQKKFHTRNEPNISYRQKLQNTRNKLKQNKLSIFVNLINKEERTPIKKKQESLKEYITYLLVNGIKTVINKLKTKKLNLRKKNKSIQKNVTLLL